MPARRSWTAASLATVAVLALAGVALAADDVATHRSDTEATIRHVEGSPKSRRAAAEPLRKARHALERAKSAHGAGDHDHAVMLEFLAREWAATASDLARAAAIEAEVRATQKDAAEAETAVVRARALLEETAARLGRAKQKLQDLEGRGTPPADPSKHGKRKGTP